MVAQEDAGMEMSETISAAVKDFILREFLPDEDPAELKETTPLITTGILDSIATLKLVTFLEEKYRISIAAHEVDVAHLNTIADIATVVRSKLVG
jgi:acyl carrier protein